ncbi:TnpV protein [Bifidobacterium pseudolongum]|uniref:TnpV protein n=1 Tax=Bifidobacterium pseudolongum TaxID=1694 RepID=UPI0035145142
MDAHMEGTTVPVEEEGLHMQWQDPALREKYVRNLERLRENQRLQPNLYSTWSLPYKMLVPEGMRPVRRMRLIWLRDNHPQAYTELLLSNELEAHLKETELRFRKRLGEIVEQLLEQRHLVTRADVMEAHPEITPQVRHREQIRAQEDARWMAIHEVIESF